MIHIEDSVDASMQGLENYLKKCDERLITATRNSTDQQNNNQEREMGRKTTVQIFQMTGR